MGDLRAHCFVEGFSYDSKPDKTLRALKTEWQLVCYYEMESLATQTSLHSDPSHSSLLFTLAFNVYVSILLPSTYILLAKTFTQKPLKIYPVHDQYFKNRHTTHIHTNKSLVETRNSFKIKFY